LADLYSAVRCEERLDVDDKCLEVGAQKRQAPITDTDGNCF